MKNRKTFFDNNTLNKGYGKTQQAENAAASQSSGYKHSDLLPPIELIAEYEALNPGMLAKIVTMAEKEQTHRHALDKKAMENYDNAAALGRRAVLIAIVFLCVTCVGLAFSVGTYVGVGFLVSVLAVAGALSYRCCSKMRCSPSAAVAAVQSTEHGSGSDVKRKRGGDYHRRKKRKTM